MAHDLTSGESHEVASTTNVTVNRAVISTVTIEMRGAASVKADLVKGESDGYAGGEITNERERVRCLDKGIDADAVLDTLTNDGESLRDALERIIMARAVTKGDLAAGTIS